MSGDRGIGFTLKLGNGLSLPRAEAKVVPTRTIEPNQICFIKDEFGGDQNFASNTRSKTELICGGIGRVAAMQTFILHVSILILSPSAVTAGIEKDRWSLERVVEMT